MGEGMQVREFSVRYVRSDVPLDTRQRFSNSRQVFEAHRDLFLEPVEIFRVLLLNSKNLFLHFEDISRGSLSTSVVHPREVFWSAVYHRSAAIICLHNHPSGDPAPSREDRECTGRICHAGRILGIRVLDHIIVGETDFYSFADAGILSELNEKDPAYLIKEPARPVYKRKCPAAADFPSRAWLPK
jgi:DNA repair protein RadC